MAEGAATRAVVSLDELQRLRERDRQVFAMRLSGMSPRAICEELGLDTPTLEASMRRMVTAISPGFRKDLIAIECSRYDQLTATYYTRAVAGDIQAAALYLKISQERRALLGLDAPRSAASLAVVEGENAQGEAQTSSDKILRRLQQIVDGAVVEVSPRGETGGGDVSDGSSDGDAVASVLRQFRGEGGKRLDGSRGTDEGGDGEGAPDQGAGDDPRPGRGGAAASFRMAGEVDPDRAEPEPRGAVTILPPGVDDEGSLALGDPDQPTRGADLEDEAMRRAGWEPPSRLGDEPPRPVSPARPWRP